MATEKRATVRIIGIDESISRPVLRCEILRWNVAPENIPYALYAGIQPELVPTGEVIRCHIANNLCADRGFVAGAIRRGDDWTVETLSRNPV